MFTVKQLSDLAGVTPRTLHHYDAIGLLKPAQTGANGYRYYGHESLLLLQQILFYRELGLPLEDIKRIVTRRGFDVLAALEDHRMELGRRIERLERLLVTVDDTILFMKGKKEMSSKQIFSGFTDEEQEKYAAEAEKLYDPETVRASNRRWKSYSAEKKQSILDESRQIYVELAAVMPKGAGSPEAQALVERWRANMDYFWTPSLEQLEGLAAMYEDDPRFKANFEQIQPGLATFIKQAVHIYVAGKK